MSESDPRILECSKSKVLRLDDLSEAVSAYDQKSSDYFYDIFVETRDGKACMSPVVLDTKIWKSLIQRVGLGIATET